MALSSTHSPYEGSVAENIYLEFKKMNVDPTPSQLVLAQILFWNSTEEYLQKVVKCVINSKNKSFTTIQVDTEKNSQIEDIIKYNKKDYQDFYAKQFTLKRLGSHYKKSEILKCLLWGGHRISMKDRRKLFHNKKHSIITECERCKAVVKAVRLSVDDNNAYTIIRL